jgi:hypothetical protein
MITYIDLRTIILKVYLSLKSTQKKKKVLSSHTLKLTQFIIESGTVSSHLTTNMMHLHKFNYTNS